MWVYLDASDIDQLKYIIRASSTFKYHVGFFTPNGEFIWHFAYDTVQKAELECHYLNGGED